MMETVMRTSRRWFECIYYDELHGADGLPVEVHDDNVHVDVEDVVVEATTMILLRLRLLLLLLLLSIIHRLSSVGEEVVHRPQLAPRRWSGLV